MARRAGGGLFVVLLPTLECNLACQYCFETHPEGRWDLPQTERILRQIFDLAHHLELSRVCLHWQGGEILSMGLPYLSQVLPMAEKVGRARDITVEQKLQTNLTQYGSKLAPLVHRWLDGRLGSSFEPNGNRRFAGDDGQRFERRWRGALAAAEADGIAVGVLSLLTEEMLAAGAAATLEQLRGTYGIRRLRFTLPFASPESGRGYWLDPRRVGDFLSDGYRWWKSHGQDDYLHLKPFRYLERRLAGQDDHGAGMCTFAQSCAETALSIGPSGNVMLCDCFVAGSAQPHYGNVLEQSLIDCFMGENRRQVLGHCDALVSDRCLACSWLPVCHGGCLARSRVGLDDPEDHYCGAYRKLFQTIADACRSTPQALAPPAEG